MKKVFSILIISLFLVSVMHITIATHFCGGVVAASKISLSGELASCGMEETENSFPAPGNYLSSHCCHDEVSVYAIENNYTPSFSVIKEFSQNILQVFYFPVSCSFYSLTAFKSLHTTASPPGRLMASAVSMADICVFRI